MKKILTILICLAALNIFAQDFCYDEFKTAGITAFDSLDFENALLQFYAANICDDADHEEINGLIINAQNGFVDAIKAARDSALLLKEQAEAALLNAKKAQKESEGLRLYASGQERELRGFPKEAIELYTKAIKVSPEDLSFREKRIELTLLDTLNYLGMSISDLEILSNAGDSIKKPFYLNDLAMLYAKSRNFKRAEQVQSRAVQLVDLEYKPLFEKRLMAYRNKNLFKDDTSLLAKKVEFVFIPSLDITIVKGQVSVNIGGKRIRLSAGSTKRVELKGLKPGNYEWAASGRIEKSAITNIFTGGKKYAKVKGKGNILIQSYSRYTIKLIPIGQNEYEVRISRY